MSTVAFVGAHAFVLLALGATAWVAGRMALWRFPLADGAERQAVPLALGLAGLGLLLLGMGLLGLLSRGALLGLLAVIHLAGWKVWWEAARRARALRADPWRWLAAVAVLAVVARFFILALYPPTAFDETMYHLPFARAFVLTGGVPFLPDLRFPVFPQLGEILMTGVLALTGQDVATHLVQWLAIGAAAALLIAWGKRISTPAAGWIAAALFLGYPVIVYLAVTGYIEAELTLFVTAGLYSLERWREEGREGWLALAAVFAGSAAGTKYHGLFFVAAFAAGLAVAAPRGRKLRSLLRFSAIALMVLAPWYVRILVYTGNPVFPFVPRLFGASAWTFDRILQTGLAERMAELPRLPWDALVHPEKVGRQPPVSPAFLLGLPLVAIGAWRDRRLRHLVVLALAYVLAALAMPPDVRYLSAILPALSLVLAVELTSRVRGWSGAPRTAGLCLLCVLPSWAWTGYRLSVQGPLPITARQREVYLAGALPVWPAVDFLNRTRGSGYTVYALHVENMPYFADGRFLGDWNGPARFSRVLPLLSDPDSLWRELRRLGADHLLVVKSSGLPLPEDDPAFPRLFRKVYSDGLAEVFALAPDSSRISSNIRRM